jgi:hypothetical protein
MRDEFVDDILTSLKIIASIKEGQKVCVRNGLLALEVNSTGVIPAVKRFIYGDNRELTVRYVRNVVHNAISVIKVVKNPDEVIKSLQEAIMGLQRLEVTYSADVATVSTIQVLVDRIELEIKSLPTYNDK